MALPENPVPDPTSNPAFFRQLKRTLRGYTFVITIISGTFTVMNVILTWYLVTMNEATKLSKDVGLLQRQSYISEHTCGGTIYDIAKKNDNEFMLSVTALMNFYEEQVKKVNHWATKPAFLLFRSNFDEELKCPLGKHVRGFLLGQGHPKRYWTSNGPFFSGEFTPVLEYYKTLENLDKDCETYWKPTRTCEAEPIQ